MRDLIINDTHHGVKRQGGSTPASRIALQNWMFKQFKYLLAIPHDRVIFLGDLFDRRNVPNETLWETYLCLQHEQEVILVTGNHDLSGIQNDSTMPSIQLLHRLLPNSTLITQPTEIEGFHIIPHVFNQEEFDKAIIAVPLASTLLLHCNIDNHFAVQSDTSLNLSMAQIKELESRNVQIIAGHEHGQRAYHNVTVIGNQFPSSIADCLTGPKRCLVIDDGEMISIPTWSAENYEELGVEATPKEIADFINITGDVSVEQCIKYTKEINELRKISSAFIIRNGLKIVEENKSVDTDVTVINILKLFIEQLPEDIKEELKNKLEV